LSAFGLPTLCARSVGEERAKKRRNGKMIQAWLDVPIIRQKSN
jgi:hypothetical protein